MNWADFLHVDANLWKLKVTLIIIGWVWFKNGRDLEDCGIFKPGISYKWFDELSRLIEWFLHADSDGIIFCSTLYLTFKCCGTTAVVLSQSFYEKFPLC